MKTIHMKLFTLITLSSSLFGMEHAQDIQPAAAAANAAAC